MQQKNTWVGKARRCLLLDASYFIDSDRRQAVELETVLTPVEITLQSQRQGFLMEDYFGSLVVPRLPARGNAHQPV